MGPLKNLKVVELTGIGPAPFCGMVLSDMGADIIRVDPIDHQPRVQPDILQRNRRSIAIDLKTDKGQEIFLILTENTDALIEGFRPGVMERLGIGPTICLQHNPKLVFGRITGWGQDGPLAQAAGHDINYIALAGVLHTIGAPDGKPLPPLNLIGDYGGGGMLLAFGIVCGVLEARESGVGQVIDASMVDGSALLMSLFYGMIGRYMSEERGKNLLDGGAHFYTTYETSDSKYICVGAIEPKFYQQLLELIGIEPSALAEQMNRDQWVFNQQALSEVFQTKTRDEWCQILEGTDACFAPVLSPSEAAQHPHNQARSTFTSIDGVIQPAPAPRFSRTSANIRHPSPKTGQDSVQILKEVGFDESEIQDLIQNRIVQQM